MYRRRRCRRERFGSGTYGKPTKKGTGCKSGTRAIDTIGSFSNNTATYGYCAPSCGTSGCGTCSGCSGNAYEDCVLPFATPSACGIVCPSGQHADCPGDMVCQKPTGVNTNYCMFKL